MTLHGAPTRRGYGHLRDAADERDRHVGQLLGAVTPGVPLPKAIDRSVYLDGVQDQGPTSSCVGQAIASAAFLVGAIAGKPIARPSALAIYALARELDAPKEDLVDLGCAPRSALKACASFGLCASTRWPFDAGKVDEPLSWDVLQHAIDGRLTGYYRSDTGDVALQLRTAISLGHIPIFGMPVDLSYEQWDGSGVYAGLAGEVLGYHAQAIIGYDGADFLVLNSWGRSWGADGIARIDGAFVAGPDCFDRWVLTVTPPEVT